MAAAPTTATKPQRGYKWISNKIEHLDPYKDYEQTYRLATSYGPNDFMNNLFYTLIFPNFIVTDHGASVVWRENGGKLLGRATARMEDTESANSAWWWYGPSDPRCQKSVESINKLHANLAKQYPGVFSHNEDYIYTLAFSAIFMHRFRLRIGLSGFSGKMKIASHLFMKDLSMLFFSEGRKPLYDFPESFDGCVKFCEDYESLERPGSEQGHLCAMAIYEHFAFRWFLPSLRGLGRSIPIALSLPSTLKAHRIQPVHPVLKSIILFLAGVFFWLADNVLPDPKEAHFANVEALSKDGKDQRLEEHRKIDRVFPAYFAENESKDPAWGGCPYHLQLKTVGGREAKAVSD
ncbi:hypothetical protein BP5796_09249 [Coleophoma crateriformis]|uniref:ER-bound oxygenase mpaB/mpaB'/Rubber oxygenase catalytic domain-containing protein n=1 Tax=Coleophoma crateriformis TaxID=565419 RepID=A0A3D8R3G9_9HELO|nr:hypothetical protein BP5796_09249 [Coleophoma crateriformis]